MEKVIIGLGNPGEAYRYTRHNFGFMVIDRLSSSWDIPLSLEGDFFRYGEGIFGDCKVFLVKPLTYMNLSGVGVKFWFERYLEGFDSLIVVHDDLDLPEGDVRLKKGGGHGGHRGLMSIMEETGRSDFSRLRIGTGRPPGRERDREAIVEWLLSPLKSEKIKELESSFAKAQKCIEDFVLYGIDRAMEWCNRRTEV